MSPWRAAGGSQRPTRCRLDNTAEGATSGQLHAVLVKQFVTSFKTVPQKLVLDFDATDNPLHDQQEACFFRCCCDFLPLLAVVRVLRPATAESVPEPKLH